MENYLSRIYELRERAAKLVATCGDYQGSIGPFKGHGQRQQVVNSLAINQIAKNQYLELLAILDTDIALRNQNTHDTFLSLGYSTGYDIYNPHDALLDIQAADPKKASELEKTLRDEISRIAQQYGKTIDRATKITHQLLEHLDFAER